MLVIKRFQVPLAPAYAMTAHGAQGRTLLAAIVDLKPGRGVSAIASYIALTRARSCSDMLIFRDFDREPFWQGPPEGPTLLLKCLRHEHIDWAEIERAHTPQIQCHGPCLTVRFKEDFFLRELNCTGDAYCKACVKRMAEQGTPYRCARCKLWCAATMFSASTQENVMHKICRACLSVKTRSCIACGSNKPQADFTDSMWEKPKNS